MLTPSCGIKGVKAVLGVLDRVEEIAKATPPVDNKASRFGNPAFRTFYDKVQEVSVLMLANNDYDIDLA